MLSVVPTSTQNARAFFFTVIFGGTLFSRIPTPSSSWSAHVSQQRRSQRGNFCQPVRQGPVRTASMIFLCPSGFIASRTMIRQLHVRATPITYHVAPDCCYPRMYAQACGQADASADQTGMRKDELERTRRYNLPTTPFAILGPLDNPGQIQQLDLRPFPVFDTGYVPAPRKDDSGLRNKNGRGSLTAVLNWHTA